MKLTVGCHMATAESGNSARQMSKIFDGALALLASKQSEFVKIGGLSVGVTISHPAHASWQHGRRSYSRRLRTYFVSVPVDYSRWASNSWAIRTNAFADAIKQGVARVPNTRISDAERFALNSLIEQARQRVGRSPPTTVEQVNSVFLLYDDASGGRPNVSFAPVLPHQRGLTRVVEVRPEDALSAAREVLSRASPERIPPFKFYRRIDGRLQYHEAWKAERAIMEHWGVCGERGQVHEHAYSGDSQAREILTKLKSEARAQGFRPVPPSRHSTLVVEYSIDGFGDADDLKFRQAVEYFLDQQTGWLGLGHCDGGSTGSGTMEVFCIVVEFELAKISMTRELSHSPFSAFQRIYRMK